MVDTEWITKLTYLSEPRMPWPGLGYAVIRYDVDVDGAIAPAAKSS
jgi:hypothetical protein